MSEPLSVPLDQVGVTPATPFTADLRSVDQGALADNLAFLVEQGIRLLFVAGNTGEVASLSPDEWAIVVETAVKSAADAVVVAGIGHEYPVALELARRASGLGVGGILAMPRQQPYVDSMGMVGYWESIIDAAGLPAVVYKRGLPEPDDLARLLDHELVVGCKYAERDVSDFARTIAADTSGVRWTCGIAERYAPFFHAAGAVGFTSGLAKLAPGPALTMQAALRDGNMERALEIKALCEPIEEIRARRGDAYNVSAVKAAMDAVGLGGGGVRPPLIDIDDTTAAEVTEVARTMTGKL